MRHRFLRSVIVFAATLVVAGCSDLPTAPDFDAEPSFDLLEDVAPLVQGSSPSEVSVLERRSPLAQDEVVTRTIGRWGGAIRLPRAGLTVLIPWGALDGRTEITVTAPAGDLVGYHFGPHGIQFNRRVTVIQDMTKTKGLGLRGLSVAYFEGDLGPTVTALEELALRLLRGLGIFRIEHFSGYVIATN